MVATARQRDVKSTSAVDGLKLALSVYNRFSDRDDLGLAAGFLDVGKGRIPGMGALSTNEWIALVNRYRQKSIRDLLAYVMDECILEQHRRTCFEKLTRSSGSVNGFYIEFYDGLYVKNEHEFQVDFQGIRFVQLMQVMQDLRMFEKA